MSHDTLVILDYGSQYTQLIARKARELGVYSVIVPYCASVAEVTALHPKRHRSVGWAKFGIRPRRTDAQSRIARHRRASSRHLLRHAALGA